LTKLWYRVTAQERLLGVEASRLRDGDDWPWQVDVPVLEFVRGGDLERDLRRDLANALRSVPGVTDVAEEDLEVWTLTGDPQGRDLVAAAARVLDDYAARIRAELPEYF
jgi:hypothetical protein